MPSKTYALPDLLFQRAMKAENDLKTARERGQFETPRGNELFGASLVLHNLIEAAGLSADFDSYKKTIRRKART